MSSPAASTVPLVLLNEFLRVRLPDWLVAGAVLLAFLLFIIGLIICLPIIDVMGFVGGGADNVRCLAYRKTMIQQGEQSVYVWGSNHALNDIVVMPRKHWDRLQKR